MSKMIGKTVLILLVLSLFTDLVSTKPSPVKRTEEEQSQENQQELFGEVKVLKDVQAQNTNVFSSWGKIAIEQTDMLLDDSKERSFKRNIIIPLEHLLEMIGASKHCETGQILTYLKMLLADTWKYASKVSTDVEIFTLNILMCFDSLDPCSIVKCIFYVFRDRIPVTVHAIADLTGAYISSVVHLVKNITYDISQCVSSTETGYKLRLDHV